MAQEDVGEELKDDGFRDFYRRLLRDETTTDTNTVVRFFQRKGSGAVM